MLERVSRIMLAVVAKVRVRTGNTRFSHPPRPATGSSPAWTENTMINR